MKVAASVMVADGELSERYLAVTLPMLLEFCDEVRILDDGSRDHVGEWAEQFGRVWVLRNDTSEFFAHEGRARQRLLDWTLDGRPDWVLSVDADETVADGPLLRRMCERHQGPVLSLCLWEMWAATREGLSVRQDGGWAEHEAAVVYAPGRLSGPLRIPDRALACGRVPDAVRGHRAVCAGSLLHWGWTREAERVARHARYALHDQGRFHAGSHLDSILWGADRVRVNAADWPEPLLPWRDRLLARIDR